MRAVKKGRSLPKRAKKAVKKVAKKGGVPAASLGAGYLGGRMARGNGNNNVAQKAKVKSTGFTEAELKAARKRIYGY